MLTAPLVIRPSLSILIFATLLFALILVNGYALNLINLPAQSLAVFLMLVVEFLVLGKYIRMQRVRIAGDPLEMAGFFLVVVLVWMYFVAPSLPTLLPPSYSGDAANHLGFADTIFFTGQIITDYPGGPALITATLSYWIGWLPIRLMHLLASLWIALSAGAVYSLACAMLPEERTSKIVALMAPTALFFIWNYFAGVLIGINYFFTQVAAQFFVLAFVCFLDAFNESAHEFWLVVMGLCLIGISVSFQLWLVLPVALAAWTLVRAYLRGQRGSVLRGAVIIFGIPALFWLALLVLGQRFIPDLQRVRGGGVTIDPSFQALGGAFLILPTLGLVLARGVSYRSRTAFTFLIFALLQTGALYLAFFALGVSSYWMGKSLSLWVFPLALVSVISIQRILARPIWRRISPAPISLVISFTMVAMLCSALVWSFFPPPVFSPLIETDIQAALWAKANLDTAEINFVGTKTLTAHWFMRMWGEQLPDDLLMDYPALGPKTFEAWRDDPEWSDYLLISAAQNFKVDPNARVVFQRGASRIVQRANPEPVPEKQGPSAHFGNALELVDYMLPRRAFQLNDVISTTLLVKTMQVPAHQIVWRMQLRDLHNDPIVEGRRDPFDNKFPFHRWSPDRIMSQSLPLPIGDSVRPGVYDLQIGLYEVSSGNPVSVVSPDGTTDDVLHLGQIKISLPPVTLHQLGSIVKVDAKFGTTLQLLGYRTKNVSAFHPGDLVKLDLYWQSLAATHDDYTIFVHLVDSSGALIAQKDSAPRDGTYPTSIWDAGEIVIDPYTLTIPRDARPGIYRIEVGAYSWPSLKRLDAADAHGKPIGDHVVLAFPIIVK